MFLDQLAEFVFIFSNKFVQEKLLCYLLHKKKVKAWLNTR
jgi:hypothetical protein